MLLCLDEKYVLFIKERVHDPIPTIINRSEVGSRLFEKLVHEQLYS